MKNIKYIIVVLIATFGLTSCTDYLDVNENPNNPTTSPPSLLLPSIEGRLSYTVGGDGSRYTSIFTQHVDGVSRQFEVLNNYSFANGDVDNMWANLYSGVLADIDEVKNTSIENDYTHYLGIAQILEAYTLLFTTDLFGDIPYSEFKTGTIQPVYDSQSDIYTTIFDLLMNSRDLLSNPDPSGFTPGSDDLIYEGDISKWIMFSYAIEARAYLRNGNYPQALSAAENSYASMDDEASFPYGSTATTSSPWYQYIDQRDDIEVGETYTNLLNSLSDPRISFFGEPLDLPHPYFVRNMELPLISYEEIKFIEAEALTRTTGVTSAEMAYMEGIEASFDRAGLSSMFSSYYATVSGASLNNVMTQKYIALFTDPEVFTDWRRTGIPNLIPNTGQNIPRRLPYPQSELNFNPNTPSGVTIFDRVPWDN